MLTHSCGDAARQTEAEPGERPTAVVPTTSTTLGLLEVKATPARLEASA